jgi:hypothetical protein
MDLRELARAIVGASAKATPSSIDHRLRANQTARTAFSRMARVMKAIGADDALDAYRPLPDGSYAAALWIDGGLLADGGLDPLCRVTSDVTRKNLYSTLVTVAELPAVKAAVPPEAPALYRARLAALRPKTEEHPPACHLSWEEIRARASDNMGKLSPDDALVAAWWLHAPSSFPPRALDMGDVLLSRAIPTAPGDRTYLVVNARVSPPTSFLLRSGERHPVPDELTAAVVAHMRERGWRRWLFQARTGKPRPLRGNACAQQLATAMQRLTGCALSATHLKRAHALFLRPAASADSDSADS